MDDITTKDILRELRLSSPRTIRRWQELGLIPSPTVVQHPEKRGRMATWPAWVLDRCLKIRELTNDGKTLAEVDQILGPPVPPKRRRYLFKDAMKQRDRELALFRLRELVGQALRSFSRNNLVRSDPDLVSAEQYAFAEKLQSTGGDPVLVVTRDATNVLASASIGEQLEKHKGDGVVALIWLSAALSGRDEPTDTR
jgi:DNA-binding transcriptional MerR regulator